MEAKFLQMYVTDESESESEFECKNRYIRILSIWHISAIKAAEKKIIRTKYVIFLIITSKIFLVTCNELGIIEKFLFCSIWRLTYFKTLKLPYIGFCSQTLHYCKSGNIRGTLIFAYFTQIQQARIQEPAKIFAVPKWQVSICSARI